MASEADKKFLLAMLDVTSDFGLIAKALEVHKKQSEAAAEAPAEKPGKGWTIPKPLYLREGGGAVGGGGAAREGGGGAARKIKVEVDGEGMITNLQELKPGDVPDKLICLQFFFNDKCDRCEAGKCRDIKGPREFVAEVLMRNEKSIQKTADFLYVPPDEALKIIQFFKTAEGDELAAALAVVDVCFYTLSTYAGCKNPNCLKKYCGDYGEGKKIVLGSIIGIMRFAKFMRFKDLSSVAVHFEKDVDEVPALVKYFAEKAEE